MGKVPRKILKYIGIILLELHKRLSFKREVDHQIEFKFGAKPPVKVSYRMPPPELDELERKLKDLLESGFIQPYLKCHMELWLFHKNHDGSLGCVSTTEH